MNYQIKPFMGKDFHTTANKAKIIATKNNCIVEFEFNGCLCLVSINTNLEWLYRDYSNHWLMEWKEVGPDCTAEYSREVQLELNNRTKVAEEKAELERLEYQKKDKAERLEFEQKTNGIELALTSPEDWKAGKAKNTDPYGATIYEYAEGWAKLMQAEISKGRELKDIAGDTSFQLGFLGITGFMYGAAVQILSKCWKHGQELRKWHNKVYNHEGDGVVNPAILTIKS